MASSSVSQDDIDNDFEKNSRRSRIRTARARQINPSGCRIESSQQQNNVLDQVDLEAAGALGATGAAVGEEENGTGASILNASCNNSGVNPQAGKEL